jgi:hypothetical protein
MGKWIYRSIVLDLSISLKKIISFTALAALPLKTEPPVPIK